MIYIKMYVNYTLKCVLADRKTWTERKYTSKPYRFLQRTYSADEINKVRGIAHYGIYATLNIL